MPRFTKGSLIGANLNGFDKERNLQVVTVGQKAVIYLADGADGSVSVRNAPSDSGQQIIELQEVDQSKLTAAEKKSNYRKFAMKGLDLGTTQVVNGPMTVPLQVVVVKNGDSRLFDGGKEVAGQSVLLPLRALGLRGAALRVAEDQLSSTVGRTGKGAGMYGLGKDEKGIYYDWCGGFAQWCYQTAAQLIGETNPFGDTAWTLASPQRAISWAMAHPDLATVIRYEGGNPFEANGKLYGTKGIRKEKQELIDLDVAAHGNPTNVIEGDICLFRNDAGGWKHVSIVYAVYGSDTFDTIDGNQGYPSIKIKRGHKFSDKVGKAFRHTFLHLSLPPVDWISGWTTESQIQSSPGSTSGP